MALNLFIGISRDQLERWLRDAQADLAAGKTLSSYGTGDTNASKQVQMDIRQRIAEILNALNAIDSTAYPAAQTKRVTRTQIRESQAEDPSI